MPPRPPNVCAGAGPEEHQQETTAGSQAQRSRPGDHRSMASPDVPVLVITGAVGAGKSTVAAEASSLLREAAVPHALVDLAQIECC